MPNKTNSETNLEKVTRALVRTRVLPQGLWKPGDYERTWAKLDGLAKELEIRKDRLCATSHALWRENGHVGVTLTIRQNRLSISQLRLEGKHDILSCLTHIITRAIA